MDYLRWYRRATGADVRNGHEVVAVRPQTDGVVEVDVKANGVIATGKPAVWCWPRAATLGGATIPSFMQAVDKKFWAHSSDEMDYATLAGKHVGVVGAGASDGRRDGA